MYEWFGSSALASFPAAVWKTRPDSARMDWPKPIVLFFTRLVSWRGWLQTLWTGQQCNWKLRNYNSTDKNYQKHLTLASDYPLSSRTSPVLIIRSDKQAPRGELQSSVDGLPKYNWILIDWLIAYRNFAIFSNHHKSLITMKWYQK